VLESQLYCINVLLLIFWRVDLLMKLLLNLYLIIAIILSCCYWYRQMAFQALACCRLPQNKINHEIAYDNVMKKAPQSPLPHF